MDKVQLAKEGDKVAFSELIEEKKFKLYKTAKAILKDEDDVCDAIQDCLISVYKNWNNLSDSNSSQSFAIETNSKSSFCLSNLIFPSKDEFLL